MRSFITSSIVATSVDACVSAEITVERSPGALGMGSATARTAFLDCRLRSFESLVAATDVDLRVVVGFATAPFLVALA